MDTYIHVCRIIYKKLVYAIKCNTYIPIYTHKFKLKGLKYNIKRIEFIIL